MIESFYHDTMLILPQSFYYDVGTTFLKSEKISSGPVQLARRSWGDWSAVTNIIVIISIIIIIIIIIIITIISSTITSCVLYVSDRVSILQNFCYQYA